MDNRFFPLVVGPVMLALGLTLTVADFRRAASVRRPLVDRVGLPVSCCCPPCVWADRPESLHLAPEPRGGPDADGGGARRDCWPTSVSHRRPRRPGARSDAETGESMRCCRSSRCLAIVAFSLTWFLGEGRFIPLQVDKFLGVFAAGAWCPTAIGVAVRHRFPALARRLQQARPGRRGGAAWLLSRRRAGSPAAQTTHLEVTSGALSARRPRPFCAVSLTVGYLAPRRTAAAAADRPSPSASRSDCTTPCWRWASP